ncbi:prepilin-type N-terminal cleavage/methylation domain-containing protein [Sulfurimonas sp.]|uniref:prepilin-type N-terminal cleavage/methylation domain-containing protein n=1 Tax=Sulfurimonas sp. TaxID=2022749 RepID=UPI002B473F0D|nr:prepilin-type N-terminal cleavage/methylation domain-containing protein [Sulfurimonas sp.]
MKKAFSLIELLIVIVIIGVVYTISVGNFKKMKDESQKLSLQNLKEYLQKIPHEKNIEFLCLDECSECEVFVDGKKFREVESFLDKSVIVYRYDFSYGMTQLEKKDDICFSYIINKQGVGEQVFVEFKTKVYDFSSYLSQIYIYDSLHEATEVKENLIQEVIR